MIKYAASLVLTSLIEKIYSAVYVEKQTVTDLIPIFIIILIIQPMKTVTHLTNEIWDKYNGKSTTVLLK